MQNAKWRAIHAASSIFHFAFVILHFALHLHSSAPVRVGWKQPHRVCFHGGTMHFKKGAGEAAPATNREGRMFASWFSCKLDDDIAVRRSMIARAAAKRVRRQ